MIPAYQHL